MEHKYTNTDLYKITECPSDALLLNYVKGNISKEDHRLVELHLIDCDMCNDMVEGYQLMSKNNIDTTIESMKNNIDGVVHKTSAKKAKTNNLKWYYAAAAILIFGLTGILYNFYFTRLDETQVADIPTSQSYEKTIPVDSFTQNKNEEKPAVNEAKTQLNNTKYVPIESEQTADAEKHSEAIAVTSNNSESLVAPQEEQKMEQILSEDAAAEPSKNLNTISSGNAVDLNVTAPSNNFTFSNQGTLATPQGASPSYTSPNVNFDATTINTLESSKFTLDNKKSVEKSSKAKKPSVSEKANKKAATENEVTTALKDNSSDDVDQISEAEKLFEQKKYTESLVQFNLILKTQPKNCKANLGAAQCYELTNKLSEAINQYKNISQLKCGKQSDSAYLKLGELHLKNNNQVEAKKAYQNALKSSYLDISEQAKKELDKLK